MNKPVDAERRGAYPTSAQEAGKLTPEYFVECTKLVGNLIQKAAAGESESSLTIAMWHRRNGNLLVDHDPAHIHAKYSTGLDENDGHRTISIDAPIDARRMRAVLYGRPDSAPHFDLFAYIPGTEPDTQEGESWATRPIRHGIDEVLGRFSLRSPNNHFPESPLAISAVSSDSYPADPTRRIAYNARLDEPASSQRVAAAYNNEHHPHLTRGEQGLRDSPFHGPHALANQKLRTIIFSLSALAEKIPHQTLESAEVPSLTLQPEPALPIVWEAPQLQSAGSADLFVN
jgi:hypothetical protein